MIINFHINNQKISCDDVLVVEKTSKYLVGKFLFETPDWDDCEKTAYFKNEKTGIKNSRLLVDDCCYIPSDILNDTGYIEVSVHGVKGETKITTCICNFLNTRTFSTNENIPDDNLTLYEQLLSEIGKKVDKKELMSMVLKELPTEELEFVLPNGNVAKRKFVVID